MTFETFIARFEKRTKTGRGMLVRCPAHDDAKSSLSIGPARNGGVVIKCFAGCTPAAIVGAMGLELKDLFPEPATPYRANGNGHSRRPPPRPAEPEPEKAVIDTIYSYTDALGREVYQAVRLKPKSFRQRHKAGDKWVWNMEGVERVLYRLPAVMKSEAVWIVEGEKDADNLAALGFAATTNVGGAGKWLDGYTAALKGKQVVICGDNDDPGQKHVDLVFESVAKSAAMVKVVKVPGKDVTEFLNTLPEPPEMIAALNELVAAAVPHYGGLRMPLYSLAEVEPMYERQANAAQTVNLDLSLWLPSFRGKVRPLLPGEICLIVGNTGVGKTMLLQNIALHAAHLKTLMFEMELPMELLFERFLARVLQIECESVEEKYRMHTPEGSESIAKHFPNLYICPEGKVTIDSLEQIIMKSELRIGSKPQLVLIDYVQLMGGPGTNRYEKTSNIAEGLKQLARNTKTIIVVASQAARDKDVHIVGLHSGKDSGSLECSSGLMLGAWLDKKDDTIMHLHVLKVTKGKPGYHVLCNFDGAKATITERSRIDKEDMQA